MEMPSDCARCGDLFELNDMWATDYESPVTASRVVCDECHRNEIAGEES